MSCLLAPVSISWSCQRRISRGPSEGRVRWDGNDTREIEGRELLSHTAIVFQDFIQYALSAGDNIALGRHERQHDTEAIVRAAQRAGADRDISKLPEGYQTLLGPAFINGTDLSTGQWQRLALARTFFRDAPLVILDELTAALDAKAEHELFARIRELFGGRSVLLISHRFSTVRSADRIYVLHEGRVAESGTHGELFAADGPYAELFNLQAQRGGAAGADAGAELAGCGSLLGKQAEQDAWATRTSAARIWSAAQGAFQQGEQQLVPAVT